MWYFQPSWKQEALKIQRWKKTNGAGEISSSCQTHQTRDAGRALLRAQHPGASPLPAFRSLLSPNHPLVPKSLSGCCTKPDPAVGAGAGQIIQSLNLFHLFLWLRIVREQMAIFSSVSVIRSHSLRQRWLKQIPGPLQSHHLVFPSAQPLPSAWARLPPACRREAGRQESRWMGSAPSPAPFSPVISARRPWSAKLQRLSGAVRIHIPALPGFEGVWGCAGWLERCLPTPAMG